MIPTPNCKRCSLGCKVISSDGVLPADILAIVDAPNRTNDVFSRPLVGPDLRTFGMLLEEACGIADKPNLTTHITGLIMCRAQTAGEDRPPKPQEILACYENILTIATECKPKLILLIGNDAHEFYHKEFEEAVFIQPMWFLKKYPGHWINAVSTLAEGMKKFL